jgi:LysR family transcriptional regulator, positive regulator for ilvC
MDDACVTAPRLLRKLMGSSTVYCDICNTHQAMDYDTLRLFLHLSRTLHFLRTSRACHVSPSALSRAVQRLERETGWPLFERDRRSVRLTPEGARFAAHARETLERWEALQRDLRGRRETLTGTIVLFASVTACQTFLPELLSEFRQRHPDIHIQLETGYAADALERLGEGRVDVSIAAIPSRVPRALVARVLLHTPLVFAAPRAACEVERLSHRRPIPWAELPIVMPASGQARESADRWFRRRRIDPRIYGELPGSEAILALVSLGCGIGIVPRIVLEESPLASKVRILDAEAAHGSRDALGEFRVGVCTQRKKLGSPLVQALWDSFRARAATLSG